MISDLLSQPTLILDEDRCMTNIRRMAEKAKAQKITLRPHFKTHQSRTIGRWFREMGTECITVSSIGMAVYFSEDGWKDITIAFPVIVRQMDEIAELSAKVRLGLLAEDESVVEQLGKNLHHPVFIWIKIDVGTHRTGLDPNDREKIELILDKLQKYPHLHFAGFLAHAGHTYHCRTSADVERIYHETLASLLELKATFVSAYPDIRISLGDTPGASMVTDLGEVDELRPGNYVFYDLMQYEIGACSLEDIAVAMACPVVAVHPERKQWVIYGGAIHFSKEYLTQGDGLKCFGRMVDVNGSSWSAANAATSPFIVSLSQEHGIVQCQDHNFDLCTPGDLSFWLPVHSCLTADAMGAYMSTSGMMVDHYRERKVL